MDAKDSMVKALEALCEREGGYKTVASVAHISPDNLWQILNGTKLPSGKPRGIGPELRRKLDRHYPGWSGMAAVQKSDWPFVEFSRHEYDTYLTDKERNETEALLLGKIIMAKHAAQKKNGTA